MTGNIRYPNITAGTPGAQIVQIRSYLHQLVDMLNVALAQGQGTGAATARQSLSPGEEAAKKSQEQKATFEQMKALIIKSADIVDAYYQEISMRLEGQYVAQSDFGRYQSDTEAQFTASDSEFKAVYGRIERIETDTTTEDALKALREAVTELALTADGLALRVTKLDQGEGQGVKTATGYTFNADGLRINRPDDGITNLLNNKGMHVIRDEGTNSETVMLRADAKGVIATDVTVRNYLSIGHARFEDYSDGTDSARTACFHIQEVT